MQPARKRKRGTKTGTKVNLAPGDTIHYPGGGRFVLKQSGANGGQVKGVVVGGKIQRSSHVRDS